MAERQNGRTAEKAEWFDLLSRIPMRQLTNQAEKAEWRNGGINPRLNSS